MNAPVLIVPGIGNSGPEHWQSLWEAADPSMVRIQVSDWDNPVCASWVGGANGSTILYSGAMYQSEEAQRLGLCMK